MSLLGGAAFANATVTGRGCTTTPSTSLAPLLASVRGCWPSITFSPGSDGVSLCLGAEVVVAVTHAARHSGKEMTTSRETMRFRCKHTSGDAVVFMYFFSP